MGFLGFLVAPTPGAETAWAGFVDDDALLISAGGTLSRAATPADAIARRFEALAKIDPAATTLASAGQRVVAAVPAAGGAYYESRDGGRHFTAGRRPANGRLLGVPVRSDGVVAAALETGTFVRDGSTGVRGQVYVRRRAGSWTAGPVTESFGAAIDHSGDTITVFSRPKGGELDILGLDAAGRWIVTSPVQMWPASSWTGSDIRVEIPFPRPGFPHAPASDDIDSGVTGLRLGAGSARCRGAACLGQRRPVGGPPSTRAFDDGRCAPEHVVSRSEDPVMRGVGGAPERTATHVVRSCDPSAPAERAATYFVRSKDGPRILRWPLSCADGEVLGTERASFVYCSGKHLGHSAFLRVSPGPALVELTSSLPADLAFDEAESASDGTTVLVADKGTWICPGYGPLPASPCRLKACCPPALSPAVAPWSRAAAPATTSYGSRSRASLGRCPSRSGGRRTCSTSR